MASVYVLGAGASNFAKYPLATGLWEFIIQHDLGDDGSRRTVANLQKEIARVFARFPKADPEHSLEELFTLLDLAELMPAYLPGLGQLEWKYAKLDVIAAITSAFLAYQHDLDDYLYKPWKKTGDKTVDSVTERRRNDVQRAVGKPKEEILATLRSWSSRLQAGDVLISFNWDILHEARLWRDKKWHYADGYGFNPREEEPRLREDSRCVETSPVKIYKLHGSVNWAQRDEADDVPAILDKNQFFPCETFHQEDHQLEAYRDLGRKSLIIPSYLKSPSSRPLLVSVWNQAAAALRNAREVFVIGYSLHRADAPARQLFACSLAENPHRPEIQIVNGHGSDEWDGLCNSLGYRIGRAHKTFEEWIAQRELTAMATERPSAARSQSECGLRRLARIIAGRLTPLPR